MRYYIQTIGQRKHIIATEESCTAEQVQDNLELTEPPQEVPMGDPTPNSVYEYSVPGEPPTTHGPTEATDILVHSGFLPTAAATILANLSPGEYTMPDHGLAEREKMVRVS